MTDTSFQPNTYNEQVSHDALLCLLDYDPLTGVFTWLAPPGTRHDLIGSQAGNSRDNNGIVIKIDGVSYRAHRLAWFYMTGVWPQSLVDHRDGDPLNNRWSNLREASHQLNNQNQRASTSRNIWTHFLGVSMHRASGKYEANIGISVNGKKRKKYLGLFDTDAEAHAAYVAAKRELHAGNTL